MVVRHNVAKDKCIHVYYYIAIICAHDDSVYASISTAPPTRSVGLDNEIGDEDLAVIAMEHLMDWETLRPFLGLSRVQKTEIARSYPGEYGKQKRECLELWKEVQGEDATYRAFITAAEKAKDKRLADCVRAMLNK